MARIKSYDNDPTLQGGDKWIGSDIQDNSTKNFTVDSVASYFALTGKSDPSRLGFGYDFTTGPIGPGQFKYVHSDSSRKPSNVTQIQFYASDRNGMDMTPMLTLFEGSVLRVTDVSVAGNSDYANYRAGQAPIISNDIITVNVSHISSSGDLSNEFVTLTITGTGSGGGTGGFNTIHSGTINPNGSVQGEAGDYYIRRYTQNNNEFYEIFGPLQATGTDWGIGTVLNNVGPQGERGPVGMTGPVGPQGNGRVNAFGVISRSIAVPNRPTGGTFVPATGTTTPMLTGVTSVDGAVTTTWTPEPPTSVANTDFLWEAEATYDPNNNNALSAWTLPFRAGAEGPQGDQGIQGIQGIQGPGYNDVTEGTPTAAGLPITFVGTGGATDESVTVPRGPAGNIGPDGPIGPQGAYFFSIFRRFTPPPGQTHPPTPADTAIGGTADVPVPVIPTDWHSSVAFATGTEPLFESRAPFNPATFVAGTTNADWGQPFAAGSQGPPGARGPMGLPGTDGESVLSGPQAPVATDGADGDFWIDTATSFIYGPKVSGAWPAGVSLIGPAGTNGTDGRTLLNGTVDPVAGDGEDGDFFINTTSNEIFGPKASGAWPTGTSIVGPAGRDGRDGNDTFVFIPDGATTTTVAFNDVAYWYEDPDTFLYYNTNTATAAYTRAQIEAAGSGFVRIMTGGGGTAATTFRALTDTPNGPYTPAGQLLQTSTSGIEYATQIETDQIEDNAVTTAKIIDNAVTTAKIINSAVDSTKLNTTNNGATGQVLSLGTANNTLTWIPDDSGDDNVSPFDQAGVDEIENNVGGVGDYIVARSATGIRWENRNIVQRVSTEFSINANRWPLNSIVALEIERTISGTTYPPGLYRVFNVMPATPDPLAQWERMSGFEVNGTDVSDHIHLSSTAITGTDHVTAQWQVTAGSNDVGATIPFADTANAGTTLGVDFSNTGNMLRGTVDASALSAVDPFREADITGLVDTTTRAVNAGTGYTLGRDGTDFLWELDDIPNAPAAQSQDLVYELRVQANGTVSWVISSNATIPTPTGLALATVPTPLTTSPATFTLVGTWTTPAGVTVTNAAFLNVNTNDNVSSVSNPAGDTATSDAINNLDISGAVTFRLVLTYTSAGVPDRTIHFDLRVQAAAAALSTGTPTTTGFSNTNTTTAQTFQIVTPFTLAGGALYTGGTITGPGITGTLDLPTSGTSPITSGDITHTFPTGMAQDYVVQLTGTDPGGTTLVVAPVTLALTATAGRSSFRYGINLLRMGTDFDQAAYDALTDSTDSTVGTKAGPFSFTIPTGGSGVWFVVDADYQITMVTEQGFISPAPTRQEFTIGSDDYAGYTIPYGIPGNVVYTDIIITTV